MALEVVLLQDVLSSYASNWLRIATTTGTDTIKIGDVFREKGFGEGAEELYVESMDISPIPGGSRLLLRRCHNSTKPQGYRMGAVLQRLEPVVLKDDEDYDYATQKKVKRGKVPSLVDNL